MPTLRELQERRAFECRLTPDRALASLDEAAGAILARSVVFEPHRHTSELARWDQAFSGSSPGEPDLGALVVASVRAAVVVPEREPRGWFSWSWRWEDGLVERLVAEGRLELLEGRLWAP